MKNEKKIIKTGLILLSLSIGILPNLSFSESNVENSTLEEKKINLVENLSFKKHVEKVSRSLVQEIKRTGIQLSEEQEDELSKLFIQNKGEVATFALTGEVPQVLQNKVESIVPAIKDIPEATRERFTNSLHKKISAGMPLPAMTKKAQRYGVEVRTGATLSSFNSGLNLDARAKLLEFSDIEIGEYTLSNLRTDLRVGFPYSKLMILKGDLFKDGMPVKMNIELLGLSRDSRRNVSDLNIGKIGALYDFQVAGDIPLKVGGELSTGFRTEDGFYLDPGLVVQHDMKLGKWDLKSNAKLTYQPTANDNVEVCVGTTFTKSLFKNDLMDIHTELAAELRGNTVPNKNVGRADFEVLGTANIGVKF